MKGWISMIFVALFVDCRSELFIDDFGKFSNISQWHEYSDTVMPGGKSLAKLVHHQTSTFGRGILFTLLDPQPCGAALAGAKKNVALDISPYGQISFSIRGRGQFKDYKFVLRHSEENLSSSPSYVHFFHAPTTFKTVSLPIDEFKPYIKGVLVDNGESLNKYHITSMGIFAYGGAHLSVKQFGVAALEIEWIKLE